MQIEFSKHAKIKMMSRKIEVSDVIYGLSNPLRKFYNNTTRHYVIISSHPSKSSHYLVIIYQVVQDKVIIITVIDVKDIDKLVERRIKSGRWVEIH